MTLRAVTVGAAGLLFVFAACADQATRSTAPTQYEGPQLSFTTNQIRDQINALVPTPSDRGTLQGLFGDVNSATNKKNEAQLLAALDAFQAELLGVRQRYETNNALLTPGDLPVDVAVLQLLHNVWAYAGQTHPLPFPSTNEDAVGFADSDVRDIRSQSGKAAMIAPAGAFNGPALVSITLATSQTGFAFPTGYVQHGLIYDFKASPKPKIEALVNIMFCVDDFPTDGSGDFGVFHEKSGTLNVVRLPVGQSADCPAHTHAVLMNGNSMLARGVNAAGGLLSSIFGPTVAYAAHAGLAGHTGGLDPFSRFAVGKRQYFVNTVTGVSPTTFTAGAPRGTLTFRRQDTNWSFDVTMKRNGTALSCQALGAMTASLTTSTGQTTNASSSGCQANGSYRVTFANPTRPQASNGTIALTVDGVLATPSPTLNYNTN